MSDTFDNLAVGNKVFRCMSGWHMEIVTVTKVLSRHILIGTQKFRKDSGREAGNGYSSWYLKLYSDVVWQEYTAEKVNKGIRREVENYRWRDADMELIRTVHALLPKKAEKVTA